MKKSIRIERSKVIRQKRQIEDDKQGKPNFHCSCDECWKECNDSNSYEEISGFIDSERTRITFNACSGKCADKLTMRFFGG